MSITRIPTPTSRMQFGVARCDVTPPVGIYHRFWGAAAHDVASGVHRPLTATVMLMRPLDGAADERFIFIAIDHCLFRPNDMHELLEATSRETGVETSRILYCFSHTHSGGHICKARGEMPGGELIAPYLDGLPAKIGETFARAAESMSAATLTYAATTCDMGHNRDCWDEENGIYVCGFNPEHEAGLPVQVVRVTGDDGQSVATIVQYPCHPTTLAWENTLISPDYVGALRETVEASTGVPCVFLPAPCGDTGPKVGFVGDTALADRNGRQVAYAALSALESMPAPLTELCYAGPVISGATLGAWESRELPESRLHEAQTFRHRRWEVELPYLESAGSVAAAKQELVRLGQQKAQERANGDEPAARKTRALAERQRRLLERLRPLPPGETYPFTIDAWQWGDAFWLAVEGEPYNYLQAELMRRFPDRPLVVVPLANGARSSYLPTREAYAKPLYQVEIALLAAGCLETVTEAAAAQIETWRR